jgi:hypothetical protein
MFWTHNREVLDVNVSEDIGYSDWRFSFISPSRLKEKSGRIVGRG